MALGTEEATFNGVVDDLIDAWVVVVNALSAAEQTRIVWGAPTKGNLATDSTQGTAANLKAALDFASEYHWNNNPDTADSVPISIEGMPLFFKITNAAGDLA
jgi:hypothetical protein